VYIAVLYLRLCCLVNRSM